MDTTDALRAEFWREFDSMVRVHFTPFLGNVKAAWKWDALPDTQSVEHLGTKLSVTLAECSQARMRVVVVPVIPWNGDAKEHTVEWDPGAGRRIDTELPCVLKVWVIYVALAHMLSKRFSMWVCTRDTHMQLIAGRGWGPGWIKLRLYAVVSKKSSAFLEVLYHERVRFSMSAKPPLLSRPLLMPDTRALWRFIEAELDRPWSSSWVGGLSLETGLLPMLEDGETEQGVPKKKI